MFSNFRKQLQGILTPYAEGLDFDIDSPKDEFGHYSTNIAFNLARENKKEAMKVAGEIVSRLHKNKKAAKILSGISVASPGFINFTLSEIALHESLRNIVYHPLTFAKTDLGKKKKINLEFVSANPTGPLTMGNGRSAAYGDALAKILDFAGYKVTREYFVNDMGNQIEILGESVARRFLQLNDVETDFPQELYQGKYIVELAKQMKKEGAFHGSLDDFEQLKNAAKDFAAFKLLSQIKDSLRKFGVEFDVWFSEKDLLPKIDSVFQFLRQKELLYESEGALWFRASNLGLEKDAVLKKSTGGKATTYLASDFAYAADKISRGFDLNIYILGADHHGDVPRLKAGVKALDLDEKKFQFLIYQLVNLKKEGKQMRMSKRKGEFVSLDELMKEVPPDAIKFFFLAKSLDRHINFDLDLAKEESAKNPVYYVQYAHARIRSLIRNAKDKKTKWVKPPLKTLKLLHEKEALKIIFLLSRFPEIIENTVKDLQVHHLVSYVFDLASYVHSFYDKYRILDDSAGRKAVEARINLMIAAGEVLSRGLKLLGISAPEKM